MTGPSKDLVEIEGTLRVLIEHLLDSQEGLQTVAERLPEGTLKQMMLAESLKRAEFRGELENMLHRDGVRDVKETPTPEGTLGRIWTKLKAKLGAGEHTLISAAAEGEQSLLDAYADALRKELPLPIREALADQADAIRITHHALCMTRDRAA